MNNGFFRRLAALTRKETRQMLRDKSNLLMGLLLPLVLILLFGFGLSFDVKNVPVAVVLQDPAPAARQALAGLQGSPYFDVHGLTDMPTAQAAMRRGEVAAIVQVPGNFAARLAAGDAAGGAAVQLILNGLDTTTANTVESYVSAALAQTAAAQADRAGGAAPTARIELTQRLWFNEAGISTWYLVPGLVVLILTLIGAFLTSLLIAREWERGTLEALFVTPARPLELVLAKAAPWLVVGLVDVAMCLLAARFVFGVPMRGPLALVLAASLLYLAVSLLLGLFISGRTRNQFLASQAALLASFMPAMVLSGFVFDLRSMPAALQAIGQLLPATHFMGLMKTLFLSGAGSAVAAQGIARDMLILAGYAVLLAWATQRTLRKSLD